MGSDTGRENAEEITLWKEDEFWVIHHEDTGVTTQGRSHLHALLMLADALSAYTESDTDLMDLAEEVFIPDEETIQLLEDLGYPEMAEEQREFVEKHQSED